ncbi:tRNA wybutosine-synthesizing protein 2 homolog [Eucyclogobius newberryi]|uniref:tRNA wybutosine-synthesizing protein 2 homolog n=1 Tax=Eucyclogobius newberryi TaxID=166745 RepID=UPI003B58C97A
MENIPCLRVSQSHAQHFRTYLQSQHVLDTTLRLYKDTDDTILLPILPGSVSQLDMGHLQSTVDTSDSICEITWSQSFKNKQKQSIVNKLEVALEKLLESAGEEWTEEQSRDLPRGFERHGDLILLSDNCFSLSIWMKFGRSLWSTVANVLGGDRLAKKSCISDNGFRSPVVTLLHGGHSWVTHVDNGIRYSFDVTKCMFSSGNITEKLRVAQFNCKGETVVDLYAGIGYFTLPYLVHTGAAHVHACEWNPDAVEALRKNLNSNKVSRRCTIHQGDNRHLQLCDVADRVNLGLIPSSEDGWPVACRLLKRSTGGILHIHHNVTSPMFKSDTSLEIRNDTLRFSGKKNDRGAWQVWADCTAERFIALLKDTTGTEWRTHVQHIEHVKSYAPHIQHVVVDLECRPLLEENTHDEWKVCDNS